jgi:hypothetical protein
MHFSASPLPLNPCREKNLANPLPSATGFVAVALSCLVECCQNKWWPWMSPQPSLWIFPTTVVGCTQMLQQRKQKKCAGCRSRKSGRSSALGANPCQFTDLRTKSQLISVCPAAASGVSYRVRLRRCADITVDLGVWYWRFTSRGGSINDDAESGTIGWVLCLSALSCAVGLLPCEHGLW